VEQLCCRGHGVVAGHERRGGHHAGILLVHERRFPEVRGVTGRLATALDARLGVGTEMGDTYEFL
jgi:hypothetical protein